MPSRHDGPASPRFQCLPFEGNTSFETIGQAPVSETLRGVAGRAPSGACTGWGIPFEVRRPLLVTEEFVELELDPVKAQWLVFLHTADVTPQETDEHGFISPTRGMGRLGERIADYVLVYADGSEARHAIRRRHQIGMIQRPWGEHSFEAVAMRKPQPFAPAHEQPSGIWGFSQTRAGYRDNEAWCSYLWAWENPHPRKAIA